MQLTQLPLTAYLQVLGYLLCVYKVENMIWVNWDRSRGDEDLLYINSITRISNHKVTTVTSDAH